MAASSRYTMSRPVRVQCPICHVDLPPVTIDVVTVASGRRMLTLEVRPVLDDSWWAAARLEHPVHVPGADDRKRIAGEVLEG